MRLIFLDTETTGLDLEQHQVWEVGAIVRDYKIANNGNSLWADPKDDKEYHWFLYINLQKADLIALNIGKYFERHPTMLTEKHFGDVANTATFAQEFFKLSIGAHLVGACVDFDAYRLARILKDNLHLPAWNYHLVEVENLLAGKLQIPPPWKWRDTLETVGISMDKYEQHTALGDARLARDVYDWVMNASQD